MTAAYDFEPHYDVVIAGARCAGAATGMLLARAGLKVLIVDRQSYGSDTMSTHALMRAAVLQLHRWGILSDVMAAGTPEIRTTTFHYAQEALEIGIKPEHGVQYLCAPRRNVLDRILVDAAIRVGAHVRHGVGLCDLVQEKGRVVGAIIKTGDGTVLRIRADHVIGADGRQSTVAKLVGARALIESSHASGYVYGYFENLDCAGTHWYFVENAAAGVIPTNDGQHCVFASVSDAAFRARFRGNVQSAFLDVLEQNAPELREEIGGARLIGQLRGFAGARGYVRQSHGQGWALVGDAGYFKDPLTAHGMTDAFRDAELLAQAISMGGASALEAYQLERDLLSRPLFEITDAIASFRWTIEKVKLLHARLSITMRTEADEMANRTPIFNLAA